MDRISIAAPAIRGNELTYVTECIESTWISSHGRFIDEFERAFADYCGSRHGIATNNGTTALHLALVALGIGPGDEVIVPTVTYIASANAVTYCGATVVLVDVLPGTLNIDPDAFAAAVTPRTKAVIPVHLYGQPARLGEVSRIAHDNGIVVVEDAAEAHGATVDGRRVGSVGRVGMFSFFGNKIITTGEGGMVVTDDDDLAARLRLFRGQGMDPTRRYWFEVVGYNYRMTNIQAALGLAQFERIDEALSTRRYLSDVYESLITDVLGIIRPTVDAGTTRVDWLYNVFLDTGTAERRDAVMSRMDARGIETRPVFIPLHQMPPYQLRAKFPVADDWAARGISLPMHEGLNPSDVERVVNVLAESLAE